MRVSTSAKEACNFLVNVNPLGPTSCRELGKLWTYVKDCHEYVAVRGDG